MFTLALQAGKLLYRPHIPMLREDNVRKGFFEPEQFASVLGQLPAEVQPVIEFAHLTGWRIASEVLPLEWRQVDFDAGEVRLDAGTTKNGEGRVFPMTTDLRAVLKAFVASSRTSPSCASPTAPPVRPIPGPPVAGYPNIVSDGDLGAAALRLNGLITPNAAAPLPPASSRR